MITLIVGLVSELTERLLDYEEMFAVPKVDWSERRSVSELWALRDALNIQKKLLEDFDDNLDLFATTLARALYCVLDASPVLDAKKGESGIIVPTSKLDMLRDLGGVVEGVMAPCLDDDIFRRDLFPRLRERIDRNLISASGGNPNDPKGLYPHTQAALEIRHRRQEGTGRHLSRRHASDMPV